MPDTLTYKSFGERSILIEWPALIDEHRLYEIVAIKEQIRHALDKRVQDLIIGYHSLTIVYNKFIVDFDKEIKDLKSLISATTKASGTKTKVWTIPVCYEEPFGLDLEAMSQHLNLSVKDLIRLHTRPLYKVYFIGFLPGFMYLGGLDETLCMPRKENPRLKVEKGSVGIGGSQTGIYPSESAGGWNIMGRTPINLFDVTQDPPCFAKSGDKIRFKPISIHEFQAIDNDSTLRSKFFTNA